MTESVGSGVSEVAKEFWEWIATKYGRDKPFNVQDLLNYDDCSKGRERCNSLVGELARLTVSSRKDWQGLNSFLMQVAILRTRR